MASLTPNTIVLQGGYIQYEATATNGNIRPGMLIARDTAGKVLPHATAKADAAPLFAIENAVIGKGIDDVYPSGDNVIFIHAQKGDQVYALLEQNADVTIGMPLSSNGAGALEPWTDGAVLAHSLEAIDNTPGTGVVRVKVEIA